MLVTASVMLPSEGAVDAVNVLPLDVIVTTVAPPGPAEAVAESVGINCTAPVTLP